MEGECIPLGVCVGQRMTSWSEFSLPTSQLFQGSNSGWWPCMAGVYPLSHLAGSLFLTFITDVFLAWLIPQSVSISLGKPQNLLVLDPFLNISVWKPLPQSWGLPVVKCMWNLFWYMGELRIISNFSHMAGPHIAYCLISRSPWIFLTHSLLISIISVRTCVGDTRFY